MILRRLGLAAALAVSFVSSAQAASVVGDWRTADGLANVRIAPCGEKLCGTIDWLKHPNDKITGLPRKDPLNPDPKLRDRPLLGLPLLRDFVAAGPDHWSGGTIYDPDSGKTYDSKMTLRADGALKVEGCVVIFCRAQVWTPAAP
jgi:uncharacterized protein (DUF2147 family)